MSEPSPQSAAPHEVYPPSNDHFGLLKQSPFRIFQETEYYGFVNMLESLSGKRGVTNTRWHHGWEYLPHCLTFDEAEPDLGFIIAPTPKHRDYLQNQRGHKNVLAGGLPFCYTDHVDQTVARIPNSLLVMPAHTVAGMDVSYVTKRIDRYISMIRDIAKDYSQVAFCLHWFCAQRGLWLPQLKAAGIPYVIGGRSNDASSLIRMRQIFRMFESVTTNQIGSHVAYAGLAGCRVSVCGEYMNQTFQESFIKNYKLKGRKRYRYELWVEMDTPELLQQLYPFLFVEPHNATTVQPWAENELGYRNRLPIDLVTDVLGWNDPVLQEYYMTFFGRGCERRDIPRRCLKVLQRLRQRPAAQESFDRLKERVAAQLA